MTRLFETNCDFDGAYTKAITMMNEFTNMTGIALEYSYPYIASTMYGFIDNLNDFPKDDCDARYIFTFKEKDNNYEVVKFIPSNNKVLVWRSLDNSNGAWDDDSIEGAVNPKTGKTKWVDFEGDGAYSLHRWNVYHH